MVQPKCGDCAKPAVWVRRTQFSGDHYFCDEHGREQEDFGKDDPSYVWRTAPTTAAAAPPAIPREPTVEQIEVAALAWRNWPDWGDYPWENVNAERHWAERALRAVFAIAGGAPAIPPRRPVNANGDENYLEAPDLPLSDEMHERVAAAIDAGFGSAWNGMSESVKQWAWRSVVAAFESAPAIPPRPRDDEIAYFIADAGQWRKEAEENERHADALAEALRSLLDAAEGFFDPSVIENQARKVLGDYDARTEAGAQ